VRKDASGDNEDGEEDELPCVIGESAGYCVEKLSVYDHALTHGQTGLKQNVFSG